MVGQARDFLGQSFHLWAVSIREKSPTDLWELAEARERLGETLLKQGSAGATALLNQAAQDLEVQQGADHPQTSRPSGADQNLARSRAP